MNTKTKLAVGFVLVLCGVLGRLLPHAWNFAPIIAIGLFAGARLGTYYAFTLPVLAMVISDMFIGFYDWKVNLTVYVAMALSGAIGLMLQNRRNPIAIGVGSMAGSTLFFLVTNGAVWLFGTMYSHNAQGLIASYIAGIPFYRNAIVGDVWYSFIFFGVYELALFAHSVYSKRKLQAHI